MRIHKKSSPEETSLRVRIVEWDVGVSGLKVINTLKLNDETVYM